MKETPLTAKTKKSAVNLFGPNADDLLLSEIAALQAEQDAWLREMQEGDTCPECGHDKEGLSYCDNCESYRI